MSPEHRSERPEVAHERSDVDIRPILLFGLVMVICGVIIHLLIALLFSIFAVREATRLPRQYPIAASEMNRLPPEPRLQTDPREDLRKLRDGEAAILDTYGWIDKRAGVVRIPIQDAMRLTLQRGLSSRAAPTAGPSGGADAGTKTTGNVP
jgi:hypothetical protein